MAKPLLDTVSNWRNGGGTYYKLYTWIFLFLNSFLDSEQTRIASLLNPKVLVKRADPNASKLVLQFNIAYRPGSFKFSSAAHGNFLTFSETLTKPTSEAICLILCAMSIILPVLSAASWKRPKHSRSAQPGG